MLLQSHDLDRKFCESTQVDSSLLSKLHVYHATLSFLRLILFVLFFVQFHTSKGFFFQVIVIFLKYIYI